MIRDVHTDRYVLMILIDGTGTVRLVDFSLIGYYIDKGFFVVRQFRIGRLIPMD